MVADFPFGTYESGPTQALATGVRLLKAGAQAIKLEGGATRAKSVKALTEAGIPVVGHLGFTPQSVNLLGGYRVQGRGDAGAQLLADAQALQEAGAVALVLEMVPEPPSRRSNPDTVYPHHRYWRRGPGRWPSTGVDRHGWHDPMDPAFCCPLW